MMNISGNGAKAALDAGKTLAFAYPGVSGEYMSANYHAYRSDSLVYCCNVLYGSEGVRRPPLWGSRDFDEFVQSLPAPVQRTDAWEVLVENTNKPGGQS